MTISSEIRESFRYGSMLTRLIYINIGVFLIFRFIQLFMLLFGFQPDEIMKWLAFFSVPANFLQLIKRFWTPLSYMFLHFDFLHLLFNILYLYWFGKIFMHLVGEKQLLKTYLLGGLAGALAYFLAFNFIPAFYSGGSSPILMGASASVMAVLFSVARFQPDYTVNLLFIGPVRLKYIALTALIIDLISIPTLSNTGGHLAHIGGALAGLYLGWQWSKNGLPVASDPFILFFENLKGQFGKKSKMSVAHKRPLSDYEYNALKLRRQKELDRILEKIKSSGYESLSSEEKRTLFDASKEG